jgi:hypothetical protein
MAHYLLVAVLVVSFSAPALAAKRYPNRGSPNDCRIVNIAPRYTQTTIRKGRKVYLTRSTAPVNMAIICKPEAAWRD